MTTLQTLAATAAFRTPGRALLLGAAFCALVLLGVIGVALSSPWLGLRLAGDFDTGEVQLVAARGPAEGLPAGRRVVAVRAGELEVELQATDLMEEPDFFDTYEEMQVFFDRQTELSRVLAAGEVTVILAGAEGAQEETESFSVVAEPRPIGDLPFVFWFQCFAGTAGFLIGWWVFVLGPAAVAARLFAVMGGMFLLFTFTAASYSARELALDGQWFRALSSMNHAGAFLFGAGLVGLFASYPKPLVPTRWLLVIPAVIVPWLAADILRLAPNQDMGSRLPVMLEMLTAIVLVGVQGFATRRDPGARAALRWVGTSAIVGCGLFVFVTVGSSLVGWMPPIRQGYAFGFFLLMDVGLALGLRRHSLLGIDEWAFRILSWLGAGIALVVLDLLLVVLGTSHGVSLGVSLAICGLAYLPVRNWMWEKLVVRKRLDQQELFRHVLQAGFAPRSEQREQRWLELLRKVFDPLQVHTLASSDAKTVEIERGGLLLSLPGTASLPAARLEYPWGGRGLFGPRHHQLAEALVELMHHAESAREAFLRGVQEERHRIARDLHDHLGAQLLTGLYAENAERAREEIRHALVDMRSVVHELTRDEDLLLADVLGDLRHEVSGRLEAAGVRLAWVLDGPSAPSSARMSPRVSRHLTAALRELISNVVRHARASEVFVLCEVREGRLHVFVADDGVGLAVGQRTSAEGTTQRATELAAAQSQTIERGGHGLANLRFRMQSMGGELELSDQRKEGGSWPAEVAGWAGERGLGTWARLELPLSELELEEIAS